MTITSVGDMRQHFLNLRNNTSLKNDLNTLVQELTTGRASDMTRHLGSAQTRLSSAERQLELLGQFSNSNVETTQFLSTMQVALTGAETFRAGASESLLAINDGSAPAQITEASNISRSSLEGVVQALNMRFGDRAMFGGTALSMSPLASVDDMMTSIEGVVTGLTAVDDIKLAVEDWFDAPAGGFETVGYLGDPSGFIQRPIDFNQDVEVSVRADDPGFRDLMKSLVLGALAGDTSLSLTQEDRQALQKDAGVGLLSAAAPLAAIQARLGYTEGLVEDASVRMSAQETSIGIARNELVSVDPFETATSLEQVQLQLETHYTLTARLSRLSLTEYLR